MQILKWGYKYYKKRMPLAVICQIMGEIAILIGLITPLLSQLIFDGVINYNNGDNVQSNFIVRWLLNGNFGEKGSFKLFLSIAVIFMTLILLRDILIQVRNNLFRLNGVRFESDLKFATYKKLLNTSNESLAKYNAGDLLTILESDIINVKELFSTLSLCIIDAVFMIIVSCIFLVSYQKYLILIPLGIVPALIFVLRRYMKTSRRISNKIRDKNADMNLYVQEHVNGIRLVKSYANEDVAKKNFDKANRACRDSFFEQVSAQSRYNIIFNSLRQLAYVLAIGIGGYFTLKGEIGVGALVACTSYVTNIMAYITNLNSYLYTAQQYSVCGDRIIKFMGEKEIDDGEKIIPIENFNLSIRNLRFMKDGKKILDNINLDIPYGTKIGVMGGTGSGKSVLLKTLSEIIPDYTGVITLGGKDIREYNIEELRNQFSYVFQDVFLFSNTIDANIAFSKPDANFEEVLEAAKFAQAHRFISGMKEGYDTIVGEKGLGLSGGQKQRISVARALIKNAPILVLDDATSALDKATEKDLLKTLKEKYPQKTLIISAHKVSSVKDCDKIIYLENGKIAEEGTYGELIKLNGEFAKIYRMQSEECDIDDLNKEVGK